MTETATTQKQEDSVEETTKRNFVSRDKIITIEDLQKLGTFVFHYNFPCLYFFRPFWKWEEKRKQKDFEQRREKKEKAWKEK